MKVITIGRSSENNIIINDAKVSRTHLQLVQNDNGICSVVDLNSANGTFVNGQKITGEVCLQPNDMIRIGDTILPWQEYLNPPYASTQKPTDNIPSAPRHSKIKRWWFITACAVFVLLACGAGLYFYHNKKEHEKIEEARRNQEEIQKEQQRLEAERKAEEAERLQKEADELFRQALISQNNKSKALADAKQKEASEAKRQADAATAAQREAESARIAAEKAKEESDKAKTAAEQKSKRDIQSAEENANKAISQANSERDSANEKARLTEMFYEEFAEMKLDFAKQVCKYLKHELLNNKIDAKTSLKELFNASENRGKQEIVDAIRTVKKQNSPIEPNESETETNIDSLSFSRNKELPKVKVP